MDLLVKQSKAIGVNLSAAQTKTLLAYGQEFERQNRHINLSAIVDPEEVIRKHFVDSLAALPICRRRSETLADMGSGASFPSGPENRLSPNRCNLN